MVIAHWLSHIRTRRSLRAYRDLRSRQYRQLETARPALIEGLEPRVLLSGTGPDLVSITPNVGGPLQLNNNSQTRDVAPRELVFTFTEGQVIDANSAVNGIKITRGYDQTLGDADDVVVTPGYVGPGQFSNQVVVRFADTLPDDVYQIDIFGTGTTPLKHSDGTPFRDGNGNFSVQFNLDLGAQVVSTVPQPVLRNKLINVANPVQIANGDSFTIQAGRAPATFVFNNNTVVAPNGQAFAYTSGDGISVASAIGQAINSVNPGPTALPLSSPSEYGIQAQAPVGNQVSVVGKAFSPTITISNFNALTLADGGLIHRQNLVNVYFTPNDPVNQASAENPAFYQLVNAADGSILLPSSVVYNPRTNSATLVFGPDGSSLPQATYNLKIGASQEVNDTLGTATNAGSLWASNPFTPRAFLGDNNQANDIDLYRFEIDNTNSDFTASVAPTAPLNTYLRLFNLGNGAEIMSANNDVAGGADNLATTLAPGIYAIGVSSVGNTAYNATTGANATGGLTTGSYTLTLTSSNSVSASDDNSSFGTATDLVNLGTATQTIDASIQPQNVPLPPEPGSIDEPGHRNIPIAGEYHFAVTGTDPSLPGAVPVFDYNFQDMYGTDPNGNTLNNAITEEQKQRTREIFEIYSSIAGIRFRETARSGLTVVTGDLRAIDPEVPTGPGGVGGISEGSMSARVIMDAAENWGQSEYGGGWFRTAMHEIGHSLGLAHAYDVESVMGQGINEPVFPSDQDIAHLRRIYGRESTDIDLYKFSLSEAGQLNAETVAERQTPNPSRLDTVLTLYKENTDGTRQAIARNDDYNGTDSFLDLRLDAGTYYIGVSSTGNTNYNPNVSDSGAGGITTGDYQLQLKFKPDAKSAMMDADGTPTTLDGNLDGVPGGTYDFSFKSGNTIYVDKAYTGAQNGTIGNPFNTIQAALQAAGAGSIVRIVGNTGGDGKYGTVDDKPYLVGLGEDGVTPLADGRSLDVPKDVIVMIDAGAILKLKGANIDVGSSAQGVDRSGGAVQILGTPGETDRDGNGVRDEKDRNDVYITSYRDDLRGGDSNNNGSTTTPNARDWGGIVFRGDSDYRLNPTDAQLRNPDEARTPAFLNTVNFATITYGGGQVMVNSVLQDFDAVHIVDSRPSVLFNRIGRSGNAAISANPNAFEESLGRSGPQVHGNVLSFAWTEQDASNPGTPKSVTANNSLNGLFVRIVTQSGTPVDVLNVNARFSATDIPYIIQENLALAGGPGGTILDPVTGQTVTRKAGRLKIDPGAIVKLSFSRIEAQLGRSNFIAEGTAENSIVFTSLADDRYGAGGTFDTNRDLNASTGAPGLWGGIVLQATTRGSLDRTVVAFGGGNTRIEGDFAEFNAVETTQGRLRVANSLFEKNEQGFGPAGIDSNRNGRGANSAATIFVRGAQPVLVNNTFVNNESQISGVVGNVISINANALTSVVQADYGRGTGLLGAFTQFADNRGALVRLNRLGNNDTNGMEVRGGTLDTETVWDDTDIVHVVRDEIVVPNFETFGGLRLQSSPDASLVVKLLGATAGFTADGEPLDITDRIGGTVQLIGQPNFPVVLTSLNDATVGAGFTPDGLPQSDTANQGGGAVTGNSGAVVIDGGDRDDFGHGSVAAGPDGVLGTSDDVNQAGWLFIQQMVEFALAGARNNAPGGILALGIDPSISQSQAYAAINSVATVLGVPVTYVFGNQISAVNFNNFKVVYVPSNFNTFGGISDSDLALLAARRTAVQNFVNTGGSVVALTEDGSLNPYGWLQLPLPFQIQTAFGTFPLRKSPEAIAAGFTISDTELSNGVPYHNSFVGPPGFNGLKPFVYDTGNDQIPGNADDNIIALGLASGSFGLGVSSGAPGDWRSIKLNEDSNDRNVAAVNEAEKAVGGTSQNVNGTTNVAQFLGELAPNEKSGDENRRLGYEIRGFINADDATDQDVYSFKGTGQTEVWFDVDRTAGQLDTVLELLDANGNVIASSDNSGDNNTLGASALPLIKDSLLGGDYYTSNPFDAGMRVVLPGSAGTVSTYFVRVGSKSGQTSGEYQLQIRLQQNDEKPGSVVQYADLRNGTDGVEVHGLPNHSPLLGETGETNADNNTSGGAQQVGNVMASDRAAITIAGNIQAPTDVDFYQFSVTYQDIQQIGGFTNPNQYVPVVIDLDYADGISRANTQLAVFDSQGRLILTSRDSNVQEDQPGPLQGADIDDLNRGSMGTLDPYIGPVELPVGNYFLAVSSNGRIPQALNQTLLATPTDTNVRLQPVDSTRLVVEDRIGSNYSSTADPAPPAILDASGANTNAVPYNLGDIVLFVSQNIGLEPNNGSTVRTINPFTGALETTLGSYVEPSGDIAMRPDGYLYSYSFRPAPNTPGNQLTNANIGHYLQIDTGTGDSTDIGDDNVQLFQDDPATAGIQVQTNDVGMLYNAIAYTGETSDNSGLVVGNRRVGRTDGGIDRNVLYRFNIRTGAAISQGGLRTGNAQVNGAGSDVFEVGFIGTSGNPIAGTITGLAFQGGLLYAVDNQGNLYLVSQFAPEFSTIIGGAAGVNFQGLAAGPDQVENNLYQNVLFAMDTTGRLYAFTTGGAAAPVFVDGQSNIATGVTGSVTGLAFSTLQRNLWQTTTNRGTEVGHGVPVPFDRSESPARIEGGQSFYFGNTTQGALAGNQNTTAGSTSNLGNLGTQNNVNFPGGAQGSLVTDFFSLEGYSSKDLPTLYFNYRLETENAAYNPDPNPDDLMRDAFRVFVAGDDGVWNLLGTNDSYRDPNNLDEFQYAKGGGLNSTYPQTLTQPTVQELYDTANWRQARIDLSPYAGLKNLRLRFDFSTAGSMNLGIANSTGDELRAVAGAELRDAATFTLDNGSQAGALGQPNTVFEFNLGYTLVAPSGSGIDDGDRFTISNGINTVVFEFDTGNGGPGANQTVFFNSSMTANQVMDSIVTAIGGTSLSGLLTSSFTGRSLRNGNRLNLRDATLITPVGLPASFVEGLPKRINPPPAGRWYVAVDASMTREEVAQRIQFAMWEQYVEPNGGVQANVKIDQDLVRLIGHNWVSQNANGGTALGIATTLPGDRFGAFNASGPPNISGNYAGSLRGMNNAVEGIYLDDLIIGFAERGEMVSSAPTNTTGYIDNLEITQGTQSTNLTSQDILVGQYQVELRRATAYGVGQDDDPNLILFQTFDTNDRLAQQRSLTAPAGRDLGDGLTFTLSDGVNPVTFEFNDLNVANGVQTGNIAVGYRPSDSAAVVAQRIRDAINSSAVQSGDYTSNPTHLDIQAGLSDAVAGVGGTSNRVDLFGVAIVGLSAPGGSNNATISEPNETIGTSLSTGIGFGVDTFTGNGTIGDGTFGLNDVDFVSLSLAAGEVVTLRIDAQSLGSTLDSVLRVFNAAGAQVAVNDDFNGLDSFIRFTAPTAGLYYVGVSSYSNFFYNPNVAGSGSGGGSPGNYVLTISRQSANLSVITYGETQPNFGGDMGDRNQFRDQGRVEISQSRILRMLNNGILVDPGVREAGSEESQLKTPRMLPTINTPRLAPGIDIINNVVAFSGQVGINLVGEQDVSGGTPLAAVPIARVINNTVYGTDTASGIGIRVASNASPTLMNNIVANTTTGVAIDASSASTVVGGMLFQGNTNNGTTGSNAILLAAGDPLFVDAPNRNFYLTAGSKAIDSSLNSLPERSQVAAVGSPIGIPPSNLLAPDLDVYGHLRIDDPNQDPPPGLGSNVFKDRGAVERVDFVKPTAHIISPVDLVGVAGDPNDPNSDLDPSVNTVSLNIPSVQKIVLELDDVGIGIDQSRVTAGRFTVSFDDGINPPRTLSAGIDYDFVFNPVTNQVSFVDRSGQFAYGTYTITLDNSAATGLRDIAGNPLAANRPDGTVKFTFIFLAPPTVTIDDVTVTEGDTGTVPATFTVTLSKAPLTPLTFGYITSDGTATAPADYAAALGTITFNPGDPLSKTITVQVKGDSLPEPTEDFFVNLVSPRKVLIGDGQGVGTILDDEPQFTISDATVVEGDSGTVQAVFNVTISRAAVVPISVDFATGNGSATGGQDFVATTGTVTFGPGDPLTKSISVTVNGDTAIEGNENFFVNLLNPVGGIIVDNQGLGTILNDDPKISISDALVTEGDAGVRNMLFTVSLTATPTQTVTVNYATQNGTATAGSDYMATSGTLTFSAGGPSSKTIAVAINGDTVTEGTETFFVNLSGLTNTFPGKVQGIGTIVDDDGPPAVFVNDVIASEGSNLTVAFTVSLAKAPTTAPVTVNYSTADDSALAGQDYVAKTGTLTFNPGGPLTQTVTVRLLVDPVADGTENFTLNLSNPTNGTLADPQGVATISDFLRFDLATPNVFFLKDYNNDGKPDLWFIKQANTGTGSTEIHILNGATNFQSFLLNTGTALAATDRNWAFQIVDTNSDGVLDVMAVKKNGAGGKTEIHVLDGASRFQTFSLHVATILGSTGDEGDFKAWDYNGDGKIDLGYIKKYNTGSGQTELHVLNGASNYQNFLLNTATVLRETLDEAEFDVADRNGDGFMDLAYIKKFNTASGKTELHVLDGKNQFRSFNLNVATGLATSGAEADFAMFDYGTPSQDGVQDLAYVKKFNTGSGKVELHVLNGVGNYQNFSLHVATPLAPVPQFQTLDQPALATSANRFAPLDVSALNPFIQKAVKLWEAAGIPTDELKDRLSRLQFFVMDLPDARLGAVVGSEVWIDTDAAGYGWSTQISGAPMANQVDLLTVVAHEIGHVLGLPDVDTIYGDDSVMRETLRLGERRQPTTDDVDDAFAAWAEWGDAVLT